MKRLVCFLFCCLGVWARDIQESKHRFVDENESFSENRESKKQKTESFSVDESKSFSENLKNLKIPDSFNLEEIVIGDKNASHTLVIYSSFSCGHCCKFHEKELPRLKRQYVDSGKLKIILRNYIDDLAAMEAAILMRIFYNKSKDVIGLYKVVFDSQQDWMKSQNPREFLKQIFVKAGFDHKEVSNYLDTNNPEYKKISAGLMKEQQRAMHVLKISSVPAFVLDDRIHQGILTCEELVEKLGINSEKGK